MDISLFNYHLPEHFIAKFPAQKRDNSKLLIYKKNHNIIIHSKFKDIINYLDENDVIVANDVKVIPARIYAKKETGGRIEILLVEKITDYKWKALIRSSKKLREGSPVILNHLEGKILKQDNQFYTIKFNKKLNYDDLSKLSGEMPIPPYLKRKEKNMDKERYQTVYSNSFKEGAVAAPTAGLHFTETVFKQLKKKNIEILFITLYVGIGTFMPVRAVNITEHKMHEEKYEISESVANKINFAMEQKKNIVAVGTTTVRTLEDNFLRYGKIKSGYYSTDIFIYPGFKFNVVNKLITNFHLPKSTLLMLVSAFAGRENILKCYETAKSKRYKFFSYGDCMFITY